MRWLAAVVVASAMAAGAEAGPAAVPQGPPPPDLAKLRTAYERDRGNARTAVDFASCAVRANQPELARPVLYRLLASPSGLPPALAAEAWYQMGQVHLHAQEYGEAVACWDTILREYRKSDRASGAAVNAAAVLLQALGDGDRAYALLSASLRDHTIRGPHVGLAQVLRFQILVERRQYVEARGLLGTLPVSGPRYDLIRDLIPVVLWKTGDEAAARRRLEALFERADGDASALNTLAGTLAEHRTALDVAVAAAARAIVVSSGARHDIWDTYAEALFRSGQVEKAIDAEEKAVALAAAQKDEAEYRARLDRYRAAAKK